MNANYGNKNLNSRKEYWQVTANFKGDKPFCQVLKKLMIMPHLAC